MNAFEEKYINLTKKIILENIPTEECVIFLFGSRAANSSSKFSDIDIGVWQEKPSGNFPMGSFLEKVEQSAVPYDVELVDFTTVTDKFRREALKHIEIWNLPKSLETKFSSFIRRSQD